MLKTVHDILKEVLEYFDFMEIRPSIYDKIEKCLNISQEANIKPVMRDLSQYNQYKFRAECMADVLKFLGNVWVEKVVIDAGGEIPDVEVEIWVRDSLKGIRDKMRKIEDSHVMVESIDYVSRYTGERVGF